MAQQTQQMFDVLALYTTEENGMVPSFTPSELNTIMEIARIALAQIPRSLVNDLDISETELVRLQEKLVDFLKD